MFKMKCNFSVIALIAVLANVVFLFASPFESDQSYWISWARHLYEKGYAGFSGNYPPVYVHWLWIVGNVMGALGIPFQHGFSIKFLSLLPILFVHLALLRLLAHLLKQRPISPRLQTGILCAAALHPALLLNGPVWGQIDLLPTFLVLLSLASLFSQGKEKWSFPFFALALLTKFQMITFLPVLGALWLRDARRAWPGLPIAAGMALVVFLPFLATGSFGLALTNGYTNAVGTYPYSTLNAGNLWMLLLGNSVNVDTVPFMDKVVTQGLLSLLTASHLGKILFFVTSVIVFMISLGVKKFSRAAMLCTFMGTAFFFLLPEMHERYLLPAIPFALLWMALDFRSWPWSLLLGALAFLNMGMVLPIQGQALWTPLSWLALAAFVMLAFRSLLPNLWTGLSRRVQWSALPHWIPEATLLGIALLLFFVKTLPERPISLELKEGEIWLSSLHKLEARQDYKSAQSNKSVEENALSVGGKTYSNGIGTHAPSLLVYALPPNAARFKALVGLDQEAQGGKALFRVLVDGQEKWHSSELTSRSEPEAVDIDLRGGGRLTLEIDPLGAKDYDHADWIQARILIGASPSSQSSLELMYRTPIDKRQAWGDLQKGESVSHNPLRIGDSLFASGLGTHASSFVAYAIPEEACLLEFWAGIDQEVGNAGEAQFHAYVDDKLVWSSQVLKGGMKAEKALIPVKGKRTLRLEADSLSSMSYDHVDWAGARFLKEGCP